MSERYLVRCLNSAKSQAMAGIYCAALPTSGMIATWQQERAKRYDSQAAAAVAASHLVKKFTGTAWEVIHAE